MPIATGGSRPVAEIDAVRRLVSGMGYNLVWHEAFAFPTLKKRLNYGIFAFNVEIPFMT